MRVSLNVFLLLSLTVGRVLGQGSAAAGSDPFAAPAATTAESSQPHAPKPMSAQPLSAFEELGAGFALSARIGDLQWNEEQFNAFVAGLGDVYHHRHPAFEGNAKELYAAMAQRIQDLDRQKQQADLKDPKFLEKFMRELRRSLNLQQTDSGLCFMVQGAGGATRPTKDDNVVLSLDVTMPDLQTPLPQLSMSRVHSKVSQLMPGLAEAVQMMTSDSRGVFILPPALSYGEGQWPDGIEKGTPLIFRVTLHEIEPSAPGS